MKRTLITAAALYLLYERQRRVERRQKLWKLRTEAELRHLYTDWAEGLNDQLNRFAEANHHFGETLVKEIEKAFKEGAA